jgi:hypothetical protein
LLRNDLPQRTEVEETMFNNWLRPGRLLGKQNTTRIHVTSSALGAGTAPTIRHAARTSAGRERSAPTGGLHHIAHKYAMWDAAYLLGSLSADDRHQFESHLKRCLRCSTAVDELKGVVALLALLDDDDANLAEHNVKRGGASAHCRHRVTMRTRVGEAFSHRDAAHWLPPRRARNRAARR